MSLLSDEQILVLSAEADRLADEKLCSKGEYHPDWHERRDEIFARAIEAAVLEAQERQEPVIQPEPDILTMYSGTEGKREWQEVGAWLKPGYAIAIVAVKP